MTAKLFGASRSSSPHDVGPMQLPPGRRMAVSPNGERLAVWDRRAGGTELWDADGASLGVIDTGEEPVTTIEFTSDSTKLAVATSKTVMMWDALYPNTVTVGRRLTGRIPRLAFSANGKSAGECGKRPRDSVARSRDRA